MKGIYPSHVYGDPSNTVDKLRELDRHTADSCAGCTHTLGRLWGHDVCNIGKKRDKDGFCRDMKKGER